MEPSENKNEIKEEKKSEAQTQEKKEENIINNNPPQPQPPKEEPQIQTFQLGDERHPVDPDAEEIEYIGERIRAIENLEKCKKLKKLLLRRNVIKKIENISHLTELKELELYDNQLKKIEGLETLVNLDTLDLSYNLIKKVEGLENLKNLRVLFLVENHISKIIKPIHYEKELFIASTAHADNSMAECNGPAAPSNRFTTPAVAHPY